MMIDSVALLFAKVSVVLTLALGISYALRHASAARRHRLWTATFVVLIALPLLAAIVPSVHVPVPAWRPSPAIDRVGARAEPVILTTASAPDRALRLSTAQTSTEGVAESARGSRMPSLLMIALAIWVAGVIAALTGLVRSMVRARRLAESGTALDATLWRDACDRAAAGLGIRRRVRVVSASAVTVPMAGGVVRPTIFVPAGSRDWSDEQREVVLAHELAHVANGDPWRYLVARLAFALYWFHPLVWLASRKALSACEQACDDAVLALGVRPSTYARVLVGFADAAPYRLAALPIARRTTLETRLVSILNNTDRSTAPRLSWRSLAVAALLTASLAAARPAAPTAAPTAAVAVEPRRLPDVIPAVVPARVPNVPPAVAAAAVPQAAECEWNASDGRSFSGSISTSRRGGRTIIHEQVGRRGGDRVIQKIIDGVRVCAEAIDFPDPRSGSRPSEWPGVASRVVLETREAGDVRRMTIVRGDITYSVNGGTADVDARALAWRDALFGVLDLTWDISQLRGEVSSKRGEISSILGQRSSLRGEISSLRGQVSSMRGEISSIGGQESSLRGEISSIRGRESSLRGRISSERGAISSLRATRWNADDRASIDARIRRHEDAIADIEAEIRRYDADARVREVEQRLARFDGDSRAAEIERRIRDFDLDARVARVNREIEALDVERRVDSIEREIERLDADRRVRQLEERLDDAVSRLREALGR